ncbi:unnamed protein product [Rotaria socialis]
MSEANNHTQLQKLFYFIHIHELNDFITFYEQCSSALKPFEHAEILFRACRFDSLNFVRAILKDNKRIAINVRHPSTGYSPLFIAIRAQQHEIIDYLDQEKRADVNGNSNISIHCESMTSCAHEALRQHDQLTLCLLLEHEALIDQSHIFLAIIECFRLLQKKALPLNLLDILITHRPKLLDEIERSKLTSFIVRRMQYSSEAAYSMSVVALLNKLINVDDLRSLSRPYLDPTPTESRSHYTKVAIIGAGPAGLMLAALLARSGIDSVVLERHSRSYVENNIRAGVLEQSTVDLLDEINVSERLFKEGIVQRRVNFQFDGENTAIPITEITQGKSLVIYGQQYVLHDLIEKLIQDNQQLWFNIDSVKIDRHDKIDDNHPPMIRFRRHDQNDEEELHCDFIAGCDGATSPCCRQSIPSELLQTIHHLYPFSWLSILADTPPSGTELIYAHHSKYGFALHSLRSLTRIRFHLQISPTDTLADWPDDRIWTELNERVKPINGQTSITKGEILERAIFPLRSSITLPMQYKRLFLVGDAAHIVPPTGAKGLNLAVKYARVLAEALVNFYDNEKWDKLNDYTQTCLSHIVKNQEFANWMTLVMHKLDLSEKSNRQNADLIDQYTQQELQENIKHSSIFQCFIAEMYTL